MELLTLGRLVTSSRDVSCYHLSLDSALTTLPQACLDVLLRWFRSTARGGVLGTLELPQVLLEYNAEVNA
jgi:hypothetical protein